MVLGASVPSATTRGRVGVGVGPRIPRPSVPRSRPLLERGGRADRALCQAKKKGKGGGKKKGGGGKKVSALDAVLKKKKDNASDAEATGGAASAHASVDSVMWLLLVVESYTKAVGKRLLADQMSITEIAAQIWEGPFVLLSHAYGDETEGLREHKFNYANRKALELWETEWSDLVGKPSSVSGEDSEEVQAERDALLLEAKEKGFVEGYEGWRVSAKGAKFKVRGATLWEVKNAAEESLGQAVVFTEWEDESGALCSAAAAAAAEEEEEATAEAAMASPASLEEAERAVEDQGTLVRDLKAKGLTNQDEEVKEAVKILLEKKADLEALQATAGQQQQQ